MIIIFDRYLVIFLNRFHLSILNLFIFHYFKNDRDWFPTFEGTEHSSAGGYGTGSNDKLLPEFNLFTRSFPAFTLYLFHWVKSDEATT